MKKIKIAVLDSGLDSDMMQELKAKNQIIGKKSFYYDYYSEKVIAGEETEDQNGHGTCCVSVMLQHFSEVEFYIIKMLNVSGMANGSVLAAALDFAASLDVDIVSVCASLLVRQQDTVIQDLCRKIYESGKLLFTSVRNRCLSSEPACYPTVVGVIGDMGEEGSYGWCSEYEIQMKCSARAVIVKELFGCRGVFQGNSKATAEAVAIAAKLMYQYDARGTALYAVLEEHAAEQQFQAEILEDYDDIILRTPFDMEQEEHLIQTEERYQRFIYCLCEFLTWDDPQEVRAADLLEFSERKIVRRLENFIRFIQERFHVKLDFLQLDNLRFAYLFYLNYLRNQGENHE